MDQDDSGFAGRRARHQDKHTDLFAHENIKIQLKSQATKLGVNQLARGIERASIPEQEVKTPRGLHPKGTDIRWGGQQPSLITHLESFVERIFNFEGPNFLVW
jgi:hypothetical protein